MATVYETFLHNWAASVVMETAWATAVVASAEDQIEERLSLSTKPRRTLSVRWDGVNRGEVHRLFFGLARQADQATLLLPLYQDAAVTTASSSGTTVNAPTTTRRLVVGQQVFVFEVTGGGRPTNVQRRTVATVAAGSFTVTSALTGTYPTGSVVVPLIQCRPVLSARGEALTDVAGSFEQTFLEDAVASIEASADYADLAGSWDTADSAAGETYYVLHASPNWAASVELRAKRSGNEVELGRDHVVILRGPRPAFAFRFSVLAADRDEAWQMIQFADAHRGRLVPFFVVSPLSLFVVSNLSTTWVDVTRSGDIDDPLLFASYLFLETTAGVRYIREITGVTNSGGLNRLAVDPVLPVLTAGDIARATTAHLCRLSSDALREEWASSTVASFDLAVEEVLNEDPTVGL